MVVSKGREMRGVVVGRNPGQSPGSHTRDSSQTKGHTRLCHTCFTVVCALTSFRNAALSASARSPSGTAPPSTNLKYSSRRTRSRRVQSPHGSFAQPSQIRLCAI